MTSTCGKPRRKTGLAVDTERSLHPAKGGSPEIPERITGILEELDRRGLNNAVTPIPALPADRAILKRVHDEAYLDKIAAAEAPARYEAALFAAGSVVTAVDRVMAGELDNAFCLTRPPGHHACRARDMGYCLINNVAVGAAHAIHAHGLERVMVVDFDVHHGNGTQAIFYDDPRVLLFSVQRPDLYPPTGTSAEIGEGPGLGYTVNINLKRGESNRAYEAVFDRMLAPLAAEYRPQIILVSAGFDAHYLDDMGLMEVTDEGYARITRSVLDAADELCGGRAIFCLEGGYLPKALGRCVAAVVEILAGLRNPLPREVEESPGFLLAAREAAAFLGSRWATFEPWKELRK